jgi:photosystem II stability/assembly factor-like uncharacterized protein
MKLKIILVCVFFIIDFICHSQWKLTYSPNGGDITCLASYKSNIIAGVSDCNLFITSNRGESWYNSNFNIMYNNVTSIAVKENKIFAGAYWGVYLSTNGGMNWFKVSNNLTGDDVTTLTLNDSCIFTGTYSQGVFVSSNDGNNWVISNKGLTNTKILSLIATRNNIFAGTDGGGIFLSTDNGLNWSAINNGLGDFKIYCFAIKGKNIFAGTRGGVFLSTNNGTNWISVNNGLTSGVSAIAINRNKIFAGTFYGGVFLSTNNGTNWSPINNGLTNYEITALTINNINIYVGTKRDGVFISTNEGKSWNSINNGLAVGVSSYLIDRDIFYVGTFNGGIYKFSNTKDLWLPLSINNGITNYYVLSLITSCNNIIVSTGNEDATIYYSTNDGSSWKSSFKLDWSFHFPMTKIDNNIFAACSYNVFLSTNCGISWTKTGYWKTNSTLTSIVAYGTNIIVGTNGDGIYYSTDKGNNWLKSNNGLTTPYIETLMNTDSIIYTGTWEGIFFSTNYGADWKYLGLRNYDIFSLFKYGSNFYAGTWDGKVFLSTNNGSTWSDISLGLPDFWNPISFITIYNNYIYIGTYCSGIWIRPILEKVGINDNSNFTINIYPNPAEDFIKITISGLNTNFINIEIVDITGQSMYNEKRIISSYSFNSTINLNRYTNGVYYLSIKINGKTYSKPFVVLR